MTSRFASPLALVSIAALAGCTGNSNPDVVSDGFSFDIQCTTNCADARDRATQDRAETGDDVVTTDADDVIAIDTPTDTGDDASDTTTADATDTTVIDVSTDTGSTDGRVDVGTLTHPCTGGEQVVLVDEPTMLGRAITLATDSTGVVAGAHMQMAGIDNAFFYRVPTSGPLLNYWDVSGETGTRIEGGAFAPDGAGGWTMVYGSNMAGNFDIYARGITSGGPPSADYTRVSNDTQFSTSAQIVQTSTGFVVAWRSDDLDTGTKTLMAVTLANPGLALGTPVMLTPLTTIVGEFRLTSNGTTPNVAFVSRSTGALSDVSLQRLNADATVNGVPLALATGVTPQGPIGAAQRGNNVAVFWVEPRFEGALHGRTTDVSTGVSAALVDLPEAGDLGAMSAALDTGAGYVVAFRDQSSSSGASIIRLDDALHAREGASRVADATPLGDVVNVVSASSTSYAVSFTDPSSTGGTSGVVQWVTCP